MGRLKPLLLFVFAMIFALPSHARVPIDSSDSDYIPYRQAPSRRSLAPRVVSAYSSIEKEILNLVNAHRAQMGLRSLSSHSSLSRVADQHVDYMILENEPSHDNFPNRASYIMNSLGASSVGENVAYGYSSASSVVAAWIRSYGHRRNIEGNWSHFGVSAKKHPSTGKYYYMMVFARF